MDDPFARLPEQILHDILSLLSLKEAARTTLVSRSWQYAWYSYPQFDFDFDDFLPKGKDISSDTDRLLEVNDRFLRFVDSSMSRLREQRIAFPRLMIWTRLIETRRSPAFIDKWISMALGEGAQDLDLTIYRNHKDDCNGLSYLFPPKVFASDFIKTLNLKGEQIRITRSNSINTVTPSSLQSLKLGDITIGSEMLQTLLRGCPLLENLVLVWCRSLTQIIISGLVHLRRLEISLSHYHCKVNRVEIEAPALELLQYAASASTLEDRDHPTLVLNRCPKLRDLKLRNNMIPQESFQELVTNAPLLESLTIQHCHRLERVQVSNPLLQKIEIEQCKDLMDIEINTPNLSSFLYISRMPLPPIRMRTGCSLSNCEATIECWPRTGHAANWLTELREFLAGSRPFRLLSVTVGVYSKVDVDLPPSFPSLSPCYIDQLKLQVRDLGASPSRHAAILDGLLSVCRPATLHVSLGFWENGFLKLLCKKLSERDDDDIDCCCTEHERCWLHELKGVEIEQIEGIGPCHSNYGGPLDWCTLFDLLPSLSFLSSIHFRLRW